MDTVVLMAAQASRTENQDAIDSAIVGMQLILPLFDVSLSI